MTEAERFDACYAGSRERLLALALVLTADLPAAREAVHDSFVAAWHHWSRLRRLEHPEAWVRHRVWSLAYRRRPAGRGRRDESLGPGVLAVLDEAARLPGEARRALLEEDAPLMQRLTVLLAANPAGLHWPRAPIVRRAGARRRRTHALVGAVLIVATLVGAGAVATDARGVHPTLGAVADRLLSAPAGGGSGDRGLVSAQDSRLASAMLTRTQVGLALPGRVWRVTGTDPRHPMTFPCQPRALADPKASTALVRNFIAKGPASGLLGPAVVQAMEVSADPAAAGRALSAAGAWFAGCTTPGMQLLAVRRVRGVGDAAREYVLRSWQPPVTTYVLGLARTGRISTVTLARSAGTGHPALQGGLRLLGSAVRDLCLSALGGRCGGQPRAVPMPVPPAGPSPMMLGALDLPPVAGVRQPWVGTTPRPVTTNLAATGCDHSSFRGHGWRHATTRSFLAPGAHVSAAFGLTETVGRLPVARARSFVDGVRSRLASCPQRDLGTKVRRLGSATTWTAWQVRTRVSGHRTVTWMMGVVRSGGAVAQVAFVPDGGRTLPTSGFTGLLRRAGERLLAMPH